MLALLQLFKSYGLLPDCTREHAEGAEVHVKCSLLMWTEQLGPGMSLGGSVRLVACSLWHGCEYADKTD